MMTFKPPDARFNVVHIDLVGSLQAIHLTDITSESVAEAFVMGWIARFGVLSTAITD